MSTSGLGDGSLGWPERAPFDAIVVTAGGPDVPRSLLRQLAIGGRLVMPVGSSQRSQYLVRAMRTAEDTYERETLEDVTFVPLIGAEGWPADEMNERAFIVEELRGPFCGEASGGARPAKGARTRRARNEAERRRRGWSKPST